MAVVVVGLVVHGVLLSKHKIFQTIPLLNDRIHAGMILSPFGGMDLNGNLRRICGEWELFIQSLDSMTKILPRRREIMAQFPVISLEIAYCKRRLSVARFNGYLQPSIDSPLIFSSMASTER